MTTATMTTTSTTTITTSTTTATTTTDDNDVDDDTAMVEATQGNYKEQKDESFEAGEEKREAQIHKGGCQREVLKKECR